MKNGFSVFFAAFLAIGLSWCGFVLAAAKQLGTAKQAAVLNSTDVYPIQRPGDAALPDPRGCRMVSYMGEYTRSFS